MFKIMPFSPKLLSCPVFVHLAQFSYIDKTTFLHENARRKLMCQPPCWVLIVFSLRFGNKYRLSDQCLVYKANSYSGGWMFNRSCSVDFFCPSLLGGFSYTQSTVSYVIYCLGKGSWQVTILRITTAKKRPVEDSTFPSVSAYAFRIANALLPFLLTLAFLTYFCKCLLESQRSEKNR